MLQESPANDGLLLFKFSKLTSRNNELVQKLPSYSPLLMHSCISVSSPRGFSLIRWSILIGCFNKTFCLVKYTVLWGKLWHAGKVLCITLFSHFETHKTVYKGKSNIWKQIPYDIVLDNVFKTNDSKNINLCSGN